MRALPLTVLVHEGPMARSYLGMLASAGHRVERVVVMVQKRDVADGRPIAPWLPAPMRRRLARRLQDLRMNHWPREFMRRHAALCTPWLHALARTYGFDPSVFDTLTGPADYARHADQVDELFVDGWADPLLSAHLAGLPGPCTLLFTGGGMVPAALLSLPQCRFIHIHPGHLPHVRGSDGLLWSTLLRGCPGMTAFYMSPGLDTGDIILATDLEPPPMPEGFIGLPPAMAYRLLYSFVDPVLRAGLLLRIVSQPGAPLYALPAVPQRDDEGMTFHFMNERLRRIAFEQLAKRGSAVPAVSTGAGVA